MILIKTVKIIKTELCRTINRFILLVGNFSEDDRQMAIDGAVNVRHSIVGRPIGVSTQKEIMVRIMIDQLLTNRDPRVDGSATIWRINSRACAISRECW